MLSFAEETLQQRKILSGHDCTIIYDRSDDLLKYIYSLRETNDDLVNLLFLLI